MWSVILNALKRAAIWVLNLPKVVLLTTGVGVICSGIVAAFRFFMALHSKLVQLVTSLDASIPSAQSTGSIPAILAKANYILPLNEMFVLFGAYLSILAVCLSIRGLTAAYRLIPFKAS